MYTNINVPFISHVLDVEYFFICSKLSFCRDFTGRVTGELISLLQIARPRPTPSGSYLLTELNHKFQHFRDEY